MDTAVFEKAMEVFETPQEFWEEAKLMLTEPELSYIALAGRQVLSQDEMKKLITEHGLSDQPEEMIRSCLLYTSRCV